MMKSRVFSLAVISAVTFISFSAYAQQSQEATPKSAQAVQTQPQVQPAQAAFSNEMDRISYAIGADIGQNFKREGVSLNAQVMGQGVKDALSGDKMLMDPKEIQMTLVSFQKELMAKHAEKMQEIAAKNKAEGDAFLLANKDKPGVVTLPDGLQYKVLKPGAGAPPTANDAVTVNYEGSLINGQVFDSSYVRGKSITFPVSEVIAGWTEALKNMKPGAEWIIYVPPLLGYGERGAGPIGPNQTLIFKIALIAVQPATSSQNVSLPQTQVKVVAKNNEATVTKASSGDKENNKRTTNQT